MIEKLESILESVEDALGEWSGVERTYCPEWAVALKDIQEDIKELIHDTEIEDETDGNGAYRIAIERMRQIEGEGFDAKHDDLLSPDNLARAAACYAIPDDLRKRSVKDGETRIPLFDALWPWNMVWWKPTPDNRIRELEKAGAFIAAEIDKLLRVKENPSC